MLLFKDGTALRLVWRSPRFSEDLDFTGSKISIAGIEALMEVSLRAEPKDAGAASLINSDLLPPYTLVHLDQKKLVAEKIQACLTRAKARDFYDVYFILRSRMAF